jgi:hypothetical protein
VRQIRTSLRPAVILGLLVGLAIGLGFGLGYGRSFDAGFRAALVGALVGGALAVVGGYLGSKELIDRDDERERNDLIGAVQATRSEMATNLAVVEDLITKGFVNFASARLYDDDYRQVLVTLARGLPMGLFGDVSVTQNGVRRAGSLLDHDQRRGGAISGETVTELKTVAEHLPRINKRMLDYAKNELKVDVPELAKNPYDGG